MGAVWYTTIEKVKAAGDSKSTARDDEEIGAAIAAKTDWIERDFLARRFYPQSDTRTFDYPPRADRRDGSRTVWLGQDELVSCTELRVAAVVIDPAHYRLLPVSGPPYLCVELDSTVTVTAGAERRAVQITGTYGFDLREEQVGALAATLSTGSSATASVSWTTAEIGTGDVLRIGDERMIITGRSMVDSTQNLGGPGLAAAVNNTAVPVTTGTAFAAGEVLLIDSERMLVVDIAGNQLTVRRGWDGTPPAVHATGADIYTLTGVELARGQLGTSDATHDPAAVIYRLVIQDLVRELCTAEVLVAVSQQGSAYSRKLGSGDNERPAAGAGLEDLRQQVYLALGRRPY